MQRLAGVREHLDGDLTDELVLEGNLRDLRRINRFSGGLELSRKAVDALALVSRLPLDQPVSLLDVGTGGADIPVDLIADWRRRGRRLTVLGIDSRPEVLAAAGRERPAVRRDGRADPPRRRRADASIRGRLVRLRALVRWSCTISSTPTRQRSSTRWPGWPGTAS